MREELEGLSVVLPCFEEAAGLAALVAEVKREVQGIAARSELVVVASAAARDGTIEVARSLAARDGGVRVVVQAATDPGYGRALAIGIAAAREPWVLLMDADGQLDPRDVRRLVEHAGDFDVVVGRRGARRDALGRRVAGALYRAVVRGVTGVSVRDVDCGMKLLRRELVSDLDLRSRTGVVNAELLLGAMARGARVFEVTVTHRPRKLGRARFETALGLPSPREATAMMRETAALALRRVARRRVSSKPS